MSPFLSLSLRSIDCRSGSSLLSSPSSLRASSLSLLLLLASLLSSLGLWRVRRLSESLARLLLAIVAAFLEARYTIVY